MPTVGQRVRRALGGLSPTQLLWEIALVVVVALVVFVPTALHAHFEPEDGTLGLAGIVLMGAGVAALPLRRRYPTGVLFFTLVTTTSYWGLGYSRGPVFLILIVALINAVLVGRRRAAIAALVAGFLVNPWLGYLIGRAGPPTVGNIVGLAAWLVALISIGEAVRYRRERAREAVRSQAEALRRRATDERLRIARELHDVVAHNMSLISIQAGVALHLMDANPDQVRSSLATIKDASREALVELRSILGVLRLVDDTEVAAPRTSGDVADPADGVGRRGGPEGPGAPRAPVPSLRRLGDLVERTRAAGVDVQVEMGASVCDPTVLPRQVDLAAFRILQESLTNVIRHSDDSTAVVRLEVRDGGLALDVLDEGSGAGSPGRELPGGGNGLTGMRERAAAVGGRLEAGPRPGRGFAVRAWLPLAPDEAFAQGDIGEGERE